VQQALVYLDVGSVRTAPSSVIISPYAMAQHRSHKRKIPKTRVLAGYKVSSLRFTLLACIHGHCLFALDTDQAALNNPSTSREGGMHARKQLIMVSSKQMSSQRVSL
jgi:hypothetical protein